MKLWKRIRYLLNRDRFDRELQEEMRIHREMAEERLRELGVRGTLSDDEAHYAAVRAFGNRTLALEDSRAVWTSYMETALQDIRFGLRVLRKNPGFTAAAVMTLALGIGANTAMFSVVNAVLLHPLPIHEPERVVVLHDQLPSWGSPRAKVSPLQYREFSQKKELFQNSAVLKPVDVNLVTGDQSLRLQAMQATSGLFPLLGIEPVQGRVFTVGDDTYGAAHVALLSHRLWTEMFGKRSPVGERLQLDGDSYEIVGVLPAELEILYPHIEIWLPASFSPESVAERNRWYLDYTMLARLQRAVSLEHARAAMAIEASRFNTEGFRFGVEVRPIVEEEIGAVRDPLYVLFGAVGLVLLIACVNVANLLLAQNGGRFREVAIRIAIGASRRRIVSQLLTEGLTLAVVGGTCGLILARVCMAGLRDIVPADLPRAETIGLDLTVMSFTFLVSLLAGILFGLVPAVLCARPSLVRALNQGGGATASRWGRRRGILVSSEIALALVLLVSSGLLLRSFAKLLDVQPGFDPTNLLTMRVSLPKTIYTDATKLPAFSNELIDRISAVPGVLQVAIATGAPFTSDGYHGTFQIRYRNARPDDPTPHAIYMYVTPGYFETMRIPLLRGRLLTPADMHARNDISIGAVRVIDESLAKRLWGQRDPIGAEIGNNGQWATIVGVVGGVHDRDLATESEGTIYVPGYGGTTLIVRTASDEKPIVAAIQEQAHSINAEVPVYDVETMRDLVAVSFARRRFAAILLTLFAVLALLLSSVGLYGVIARVVAQRTQEIGIRMALGAQPAEALRLVLREGMALTLLGVMFGLMGSIAVEPIIANQLFGVRPFDPCTLISVSLLLISLAMVAAYIPARRATRVDPMMALRHE